MRSEDNLSAIISSANDAIITADDAGNIVSWNPAATGIFGYDESETVGRQLTLIIPERFHEQHLAGHARVVETGETRIIGQTVEITGLRKDGSEVPIELSLATWLADDRRFFSAIIRDVTERVQLLNEIQATEHRLEAILESANDAIISIDSRGVILLWNHYAELMFGYKREDMVGKLLIDIVPERFRDAHTSGIARVASGGETHVIGSTVELMGLHSDGREFPIELSLAKWETDGEVYFSGIVRDITERKSAEEAVREASEELAQKNEMLEGLSAKLAKYLSRQVYDSIFSGRTDVKVESYRKKLTVFFSDIQGFTELTDRMEAESLSHLLNGYLSDMADIAEEHGGTVDKFIGDGIMIFFGDPESVGERGDAVACGRMALAMRERITELKDEWQREAGSVELFVRMGINTGWCTVGNFGSGHRLDYTIVGKEVNAASRLENAAQPDQIHISHDTYEMVKEVLHCEPVGEVKVKGLAYPLKSYEIVGVIGESPPVTDQDLAIDVANLDDEARQALLRALTESGD